MKSRDDLVSRLGRRAARRWRHALTERSAAYLEALQEERDQQALVLHINRLLLSQLELEPLFETFSSALWDQVRHEFISMSILEKDTSLERLQFVDTPTFRGRYQIGCNLPLLVMRAHNALRTGQIDLLGPEQIERMEPPELVAILRREGIRSICQVPLVARGRALGVLSLGSRAENHFTGKSLSLLELIRHPVALALDNALAFQEIQTLRDKLSEEKLYLEEEVRSTFATGEIIGKSQALLRVLHQVETVAPSDATVLLLGETGTGKELVARAIHDRSRRQARTFVKLNCSAIPLGLLESELFGHERGAFTGAIARKVGRFELAHQGSLFMDEVGDLPLDLQPKLLRAIQEREFERLGSNQTMRVDVRLIAATHRDLPAMVAKGTFRSDLFYRLNVFPIHVPALRERKEDIPSLVRYFTQKFAKAMDKRIERIPAAAMDAMVAWPWPGNVRELQNLVERAVILSPGEELRVPISELKTALETEENLMPGTLEQLERKGIVEALKASGGLVGGPKGAAARLGLKRTTLHSKMRKLGIERVK
jgi:formate hydrogenlyase transcriptional activator